MSFVFLIKSILFFLAKPLIVWLSTGHICFDFIWYVSGHNGQENVRKSFNLPVSFRVYTKVLKPGETDHAFFNSS